MPVAHAVASGMNGVRAAGDLVARLEMAKGMKLAAAKQYVADRLGTSVADLADPLVMHEVRGEQRLGRVFEAEPTYPDDPSPQEPNVASRRFWGCRFAAPADRGSGATGAQAASAAMWRSNRGSPTVVETSRSGGRRPGLRAGG